MPQTPEGDNVPFTPLLGLCPKRVIGSITILLWLCVSIWGYAPSPARAPWRVTSLLMEMKLRKRGSILPWTPPFAVYFFLFEARPLARGLGRSPKWGTEASVCPVGTCAKRKANRRSQPKRAEGTAVPSATIEVAGAKAGCRPQTFASFGAKPQIVGCRGQVPCRGVGRSPTSSPSTWVCQ